MNRFKEAMFAALPIVREYARHNPRHYMGDNLQDPQGAHAWLENYDPARNPCGECCLKKGERCDICGATSDK